MQLRNFDFLEAMTQRQETRSMAIPNLTEIVFLFLIMFPVGNLESECIN